MKNNQENKSNKPLIISLVISIFALIGIAAVGTFSFYTAKVGGSGNNPNRVSLDTANLKATLENGTLSGANLRPGDAITKTFSVKNTGNIDIRFKLLWKTVSNEFVNKNDLEVTLKENANAIISSADKKIVPNTTTTAISLKENLFIKAGETKNYVLTITYKNTSADQNADMGKSLQAVIGIGA